MIKTFDEREYFAWICRMVSGYLTGRMYQKLLEHLHRREFVFTLEKDRNRAEDGIELRYRFGRLKKYPTGVVKLYSDGNPCSILEMMAALSIRCEEHIMDDPAAGDRTGDWFWSMVSNLGLSKMTDGKFDASVVDDILDRFINREYERDGTGGLFTVHNCAHDLRREEIWYQMCWRLDELLER